MSHLHDSSEDPDAVPVIRVRDPEDLLGLVPRLIGFHPERSVVLLTVGAAGQPFHARVDLPADPVGVEDVAAHLTGVAVRHQVRRAVVVLYARDAGLAEAMADELARRLCRDGVEVLCRLRADAGRWWDLDDADDDQGHPYDLRSHPMTAEGVLEGRVVLASRQALADSLVGDDEAETQRIAVLGDELLGRLARCADQPLGAAARHDLDLEARWLRRRVRRFLHDGERLDAHDVARVATLTTAAVVLRDVAWTEMDREDAVRHVDLWRDVARRVPVALRAAPAALLGFAAWLAGDGALAWCAVDRSLEADPGYGLAILVGQALDGAVAPSTWRPPERLSPYAG